MTIVKISICMESQTITLSPEEARAVYAYLGNLFSQTVEAPRQSVPIVDPTWPIFTPQFPSPPVYCHNIHEGQVSGITLK